MAPCPSVVLVVDARGWSAITSAWPSWIARLSGFRPWLSDLLGLTSSHPGSIFTTSARPCSATQESGVYPNGPSISGLTSYRPSSIFIVPRRPCPAAQPSDVCKRKPAFRNEHRAAQKVFSSRPRAIQNSQQERRITKTVYLVDITSFHLNQTSHNLVDSKHRCRVWTTG